MNGLVDIGKRYIFVGITINAIGYLLFTLFIFVDLFESITNAFLFSSLIVLPISYAANRIWVFKSSQNTFYESIKFFFIYSCAVLAGVTSIHIFGKLVENPYLVQFLSALVIGATTFIVHFFWTFRFNRHA